MILLPRGITDVWALVLETEVCIAQAKLGRLEESGRLISARSLLESGEPGATLEMGERV